MRSSSSPRFRLSLVPLLAAALSACGGGGGDDSNGGSPAAVETGTAEGVYGGTLSGASSNRDFQLLVLENGEFWAIYGVQAGTFGVTGFLQGSGTSSAGTFAASNGRDFGYAPAQPIGMSASYSSASRTLAGTVATAAGPVNFSGGPVASSLYRYDGAASLSAVAGTWPLSMLTGETATVTIAVNGGFATTTSFGCSLSGSVAPRASGKNVYDVTLNFGAAPCALPNSQARGIAVTYPLANGQSQLIVAVTNGARTLGTAAFGIR